MEKPTTVKLRLKDLEPWDLNPRQMSAEATEGLREAIGELGLIDIPVVNTKGGKKRIIGGHQRAKILMEEGYEYADCIIVSLDKDAEQAANIALNNPAIQGKWDLKAAVPNMQEILDNLPKPDHMQFDALRKELRYKASLNPDTAPFGDKRVKKGKASSKKGGIYRLGQHVLCCGDALKVHGELFGNDKAHACITDPPYNVGYAVGKNGNVKNDGLDPKRWAAFMHDACEMILDRTKGPCYIFMSSKALPDLQSSWETWGGSVHRWLVWAKHNPTMMAMRTVDFQNQYEWIMYGWRDGAKVRLPETPRTNDLPYPRPASNKLHPTQKPLELIRDLVADATDEGQTVFDPFAGSGTTLVACEGLERSCIACEIDPHHCDTIRKRWAETTYGENCDWKKQTKMVEKI